MEFVRPEVAMLLQVLPRLISLARSAWDVPPIQTPWDRFVIMINAVSPVAFFLGMIATAVCFHTLQVLFILLDPAPIIHNELNHAAADLWRLVIDRQRRARALLTRLSRAILLLVTMLGLGRLGANAEVVGTCFLDVSVGCPVVPGHPSMTLDNHGQPCITTVAMEASWTFSLSLSFLSGIVATLLFWVGCHLCRQTRLARRSVGTSPSRPAAVPLTGPTITLESPTLPPPSSNPGSSSDHGASLAAATANLEVSTQMMDVLSSVDLSKTPSKFLPPIFT